MSVSTSPDDADITPIRAVSIVASDNNKQASGRWLVAVCVVLTPNEVLQRGLLSAWQRLVTSYTPMCEGNFFGEIRIECYTVLYSNY